MHESQLFLYVEYFATSEFIMAVLALLSLEIVLFFLLQDLEVNFKINCFEM